MGDIFELKGNNFELNQRLNSHGTAKSLLRQGLEISKDVLHPEKRD